jgi:hypothetical protein
MVRLAIEQVEESGQAGKRLGAEGMVVRAAKDTFQLDNLHKTERPISQSAEYVNKDPSSI